jgi:hypothetical protein
MRFSLHLAIIALAVAVLGTASVASSDDRDPRAAVVGRQKIRAELAAALVDGHISRADHARLLQDAQRLLGPGDYRAFASALDRMDVGPAVRTSPIIADSGDNNSSSNRTATGRRPGVQARMVDAEIEKREPVPTPAPRHADDVTPAKESPFVEEVPPGAVISHPRLEVEDEGEEIQSPHMNDGNECNDGVESNDGVQCDDDCCGTRFGCHDFLNIDVDSGVVAFKGPVDFNDANGNFGGYSSVNAAIPLLPKLGLGAQLGVNGVFSDLKGIPFSVPNGQIRSQLFTTIGLFDRIDTAHGRVAFGAAYDYLFDEYYSYMQMGQWRGKVSYEFNPWNEVGVSGSVMEHGAPAVLNAFGTVDFLYFKPIDQGYAYWTHTFENQASLSGRFGVAERPGQFVFGMTGKAPLTNSLSMVSDFTYIMPSQPGGPVGQTQESWNVSVGLEIKFGGPRTFMGTRFAPLLPVADNGSFALRQLQ